MPVYLKSNITKLYVIGVSNGKEERVEVPLWQIELFRTRAAAKKGAARMAEYASLYMTAGKDGVPLREKPTNAPESKRVYRLRADETVKVLRLVQGEAVYTGSEALPGDWYEVLAGDGSKGYVFSYAMNLFDENKNEAPKPKEAQTDAEAINAVFARTWRPAWYQAMIDENNVDVDYFALRFGLFGDAVNRQIRVEMPGVSKVFQYSNISQDGVWLVFGSSGLRLRFDSSASLIASWGTKTTGLPEDTAGWKEGDDFIRFVSVGADIREVIRSEEARRAEALRRFFALVSAAGDAAAQGSGVVLFSSPAAGSFELWPSGLYSWQDTLFLPPGFPPSADDSAPEQKGRASFGLPLSPGLSKTWQGGFSLYPDSTGQRSDYLYRLEGRRLTLAKAARSVPGLPLDAVESKLGTAVFELSAAH